MSIKIYQYKGCSTCKKALDFLDEHNVSYESVPIVDQPPTLHELQRMLNSLKNKGETFRKLFNTSGELYRELDIATKLEKGMTETEALKLLSQHGKLIKRPFLLTPIGDTVGFKAETWAALV